MSERNEYRSVFISDVHIGAVGSRGEQALRFLESFQTEYLYIVGDLIDGWVGRKDRKWGPTATGIIREILEHGSRGTTVRYTPGNHDAFMRRVHGVQLGNIDIEPSFHHETADGRDLLVVHGDVFDRSCTKYQPIAFVGAWAYEVLGLANASLNRKRSEDGKHPIDFTTVTKRSIKKFIGKATHYEELVMDYAREAGFDGAVCGHVHRPQIVEQPDGFLYVNTGDFVENCTAVVEHADGRLELLWLNPETPASKGWRPRLSRSEMFSAK
ncbi:MAG: metallophosphoesterase [Armatimonadetes bacterium]|nr:metallophosphoesterase [Armatimonadota bacterium]MBS1710461.1 metallophosphoesterase [Armatimonadota bacterium]MBX3108132.1 metallophosphoesterase [Fimbriimonadaceae bacterium]